MTFAEKMDFVDDAIDKLDKALNAECEESFGSKGRKIFDDMSVEYFKSTKAELEALDAFKDLIRGLAWDVAATKEQALLALKTYPGGLQVGGGITPENAKEFLDAGASHVIVTSYLFEGDMLSREKMECLCKAVA